MSAENYPNHDPVEQLQSDEQQEGAVSFPYQGKLDLPDDVKDRITPSLNKRYKSELMSPDFTDEKHQQLADSIHMMYIIDQVPIEWISYEDAEQSWDQLVRNNSLLSTIEDIPHSIWWVIPLSSYLALGQEAKAALESYDITIQDALLSTKHELSSTYTKEQIKGADKETKKQMKETNKERKKFARSDEYSKTKEAIAKTHATLDQNKKWYTEVLEDTEQQSPVPESPEDQQEKKKIPESKESPEHKENVKKVNDNLSILDEWLEFKDIQEQAQKQTEIYIRKTLDAQIQVSLKKAWLSKEERKVYLDAIMQDDKIASMTQTLAHVGMEFMTNALNKTLIPGLNPKDAITQRAQLLSRFTLLWNKDLSKTMDGLFRNIGIDKQKLKNVWDNFNALFPVLVDMIAQPIKMATYKETEKSEDHTKKQETILALWKQAALRIADCFDNYALTSSFVERSYQWESMDIQHEAANFLSHSLDPDTWITDQHEIKLVSDLASITDLIPDDIENPKTQAALKEVITWRMWVKFIESSTWKMVAWLADSMFTRERLAKDWVLQSIVKLMFEFMWFEIPLDEVHDTIDASQTVIKYVESESNYTLEAKDVTSQEKVTEYTYGPSSKLSLPVWTWTDSKTPNYFSQELWVWIMEDSENGELSYHKQKNDKTTLETEIPSEVSGNPTMTSLILQDFNPLAFIDAAQQWRWVEATYSPAISALVTWEGAVSYDKIPQADIDSALTADLWPHIHAILTSHDSLHDQQDLVWLLMKRIQKAWWFDAPEAPVVEAGSDEKPSEGEGEKVLTKSTWLLDLTSYQALETTNTQKVQASYANNILTYSPVNTDQNTIDTLSFKFTLPWLSQNKQELFKSFNPITLLKYLDTIHQGSPDRALNNAIMWTPTASLLLEDQTFIDTYQGQLQTLLTFMAENLDDTQDTQETFDQWIINQVEWLWEHKGTEWIVDAK